MSTANESSAWRGRVVETTIWTSAIITFAAFAWCFLVRPTSIGGDSYKRIIDSKDLIADVLPPPIYAIDCYLTAQLARKSLTAEGATQTTHELLHDLDRQVAEFNARCEYWRKTLTEESLKLSLESQLIASAEPFLAEIQSRFIPACQKGEAAICDEVLAGRLHTLFLQHRKGAKQLSDLATQDARRREAAIMATAGQRMKIVGGVALMICIGAAVATNVLSSRQMKSHASGAAILAQHATQSSELALSLLSATKQLEESVQEISANISGIVTECHSAEQVTRIATEVIHGLDQSGQQIGKVIKDINSIAGQTNLLALNATIEAARAGEMGRGFAVVAGEVKELSKQTSNATTDIIARIESIQHGTEEANSAIRTVNDVIRNVAKSQESIAAAVSQQICMASTISTTVHNLVEQAGNAANRLNTSSSLANTVKDDFKKSARPASPLAKQDSVVRNVPPATSNSRGRFGEWRSVLDPTPNSAT